jgi:hypothetical protein
MEILHYLNILGGSVAGLPSTPVAILQQPGKLMYRDFCSDRG